MNTEKDAREDASRPAWPAAATEEVLSGDDARRIDLASDVCPCRRQTADGKDDGRG